MVSILEEARSQVVRSVNSAMVLAYWQIGRAIVQYHQGGAVRAEYGDQLLDLLSARLGERVDRGYSTTNLRYFRTFYLAYADRAPKIRHIQAGESAAVAVAASKIAARRIRHTPGESDLESAILGKLSLFLLELARALPSSHDRSASRSRTSTSTSTSSSTTSS